VVPDSILNRSNRKVFLNPGGDVLWPAPEGTCFGYEYGTGSWRVPPSITGAVWDVVEQSGNQTVIRAEVDLVNNLQTGIPCEFERHILVECTSSSLTQKVTEIIRYIGKKSIGKGEFKLAPWTLCQFDSGEMGKVIIPVNSKDDIWDLYDSSEMQRSVQNGICTVETDTKKRFQLGLGANVGWLEYIYGNEFHVKRFADALPSRQNYIDISDSPPDQLPSERGVKLSNYCDPSGFMEIEACGGSSDSLETGTELRVKVITEYSFYNVG